MRYRICFMAACMAAAAAVVTSRSGAQRLAENDLLEAGQFPWMEANLRNHLNGLINQRESLRRDVEAAASQRREAEARKAAADSKLAAASSRKSVAANEYNPVLQAEQKASAEHHKLQQQLVQVREDVDKFHRGVDAATAELKATNVANEANDKATEELQRDMAAASAKLGEIHAAVQKIPEVAKRAELRKDIKVAETKLKSLKQKVADLQAENSKATSKYTNHEASGSKGAESLGRKVTTIELLVSLRQKQLAHLQRQLMRFRRAIQTRIKGTVDPLNAKKNAAEQRQAVTEQQRQRVLQQSLSVELLSNASDAELANLQAAQTSLRNKHLSEQQSVRKAMEVAQQIASEAIQRHVQLKKSRAEEIALVQQRVRDLKQENTVLELRFNTNKTVYDQRIANAENLRADAVKQLETAQAAEEVFKATIKQQIQVLDEDRRQLEFRISQEEMAFESVRRRLRDQRNAALSEINRLQIEKEKALHTFNITMGKLDLARAAAERALGESETVANRERDDGRQLLAQLAKQLREGDAKFDIEIQTLRSNQEAELASLNANITTLLRSKGELEAQARNLNNDRTRLQQDIAVAIDKIGQQRQQLLATDAEKRTLQTAVAELEAKFRASQAASAEVQRKLATVMRRLQQAEADVQGIKSRKTDLEKKVSELNAQQARLDANADAIEKAMAAIRVEGGAGSRAVQDALFKLGQQLEQTQSEKSRLEDAATAIEKNVAALVASKANLDQAIAELNAKVTSQTALGVSDSGVDSLLSNLLVAQSELDRAKAVSSRAELEAAQLRKDAQEERAEVVGTTKSQLMSAQQSLESLRQELANVRAGALPKELQQQMSTSHKTLAAAAATTVDDLLQRLPAPSVPASVLASLDQLQERITRLEAHPVVPGSVASIPAKVEVRTRVFMHAPSENKPGYHVHDMISQAVEAPKGKVEQITLRGAAA